MTLFSRVGIPEEILTDQGRQFTANYMQELMDTMNIKHLMSGSTMVEWLTGGLIRKRDFSMTSSRGTAHEKLK